MKKYPARYLQPTASSLVKHVHPLNSQGQTIPQKDENILPLQSTSNAPNQAGPNKTQVNKEQTRKEQVKHEPVHQKEKNQKKDLPQEKAKKELIAGPIDRKHIHSQTNRSVYCFGKNTYGTVGNGTLCAQITPQKVSLNPDLEPIQIDCGGNSLAILMKTGEIYTSGYGQRGRLGQNSTTDSSIPKKVQTDVAFIFVSCGDFHMAALTPAGDLYTWGAHQGLGIAQTEDALVPQKVQVEGTVKMVRCGRNETYFVTEAQQIYVCRQSKLPERIAVGHFIVDLAVGPTYILFIDRFANQDEAPNNLNNDNNPNNNNLNNINNNPNNNDPSDINNDSNNNNLNSPDDNDLPNNFNNINPNNNNNFKKTDDLNCRHTDNRINTGKNQLEKMSGTKSHVFVLGEGQFGCLGLGPKVNKVTAPTLIESLEGYDIVQVSCGCSFHHPHSFALASSGAVYAFGDGYKWKLGNQTQEPLLLPTLVFDGISSICAGGIHSVAKNLTQDMVTWGCGSDGRLGFPEQKGHRYLYKEIEPRKVDFGKNVVEMVAAGYYHSAALVVTE